MNLDEAAKDYDYDVAISYASEDGLQAESLAAVLRDRGVHVFYDKYEKAVLWGKDLYNFLSNLYQNKSRYCILFLSKYYVAKLWTKHELQSAQARALREQEAYIFPIRLDDTQIPGILPTIAYLDWSQETPETIADLLIEKLTVASRDYAAFAKRLSQETILNFIDEATSQIVFILGRFSPKRKAILDALREALRIQGYVPILFDFDKPGSQDLTETVSTLASLSRFIIVDLTDPSSAPYEVGKIASNHIRPIQAIFHSSKEERRVFAMFPDLVRRYHWVLPPYEYQNQDHLLATLKEHVIEPAEQKARELERR